MGTILPTLEMKDIKNVVRNVHTPTHVEADRQTHTHILWGATESSRNPFNRN